MDSCQSEPHPCTLESVLDFVQVLIHLTQKERQDEAATLPGILLLKSTPRPICILVDVRGFHLIFHPHPTTFLPRNTTTPLMFLCILLFWWVIVGIQIEACLISLSSIFYWIMSVVSLKTREVKWEWAKTTAGSPMLQWLQENSIWPDRWSGEDQESEASFVSLGCLVWIRSQRLLHESGPALFGSGVRSQLHESGPAFLVSWALFLRHKDKTQRLKVFSIRI